MLNRPLRELSTTATSRSYTRFETSQNVFLCPQMLLAQLIHSINCDEHDGQGSHVINHEMSSLVVPR